MAWRSTRRSGRKRRKFDFHTGIGSYAAKLGGHKRHRDALMFVGAQDLSVLAALLLLAATGPGGLSVDAKYGKGN